MDNFDLRKFLAEGKLYENTEALSREEVVDMAQKIADEFSYEDAQEGGSSMVYMVGNVDGMRFELDTKATNRTPADDAKYGTGEGWGGSFRIDVKPNGYEIRNTEKGGLVATMDMEDGFKMLSADESRAEMGLEEGEMLDEGLLDKIKDKIVAKVDKIKSKFSAEEIAKMKAVAEKAIGKSAEEVTMADFTMDNIKKVGKAISALNEEEQIEEGLGDKIQGLGAGLGLPAMFVGGHMAMASAAGGMEAFIAGAIALVVGLIGGAVVKSMKEGEEEDTYFDSEGNEYPNITHPGAIGNTGTNIIDLTDMPMDEAKDEEMNENKPSNKMKKSELKEMIRAAMLAETQVEETLVDADQDMAEAILNALGGEAAFEAVVRAMSTDDAQTYLGAIMRDHDIEMGPVGDIPGFEGTKDALDSLSLREEEEDIEAEIEADDDIEIDADMDMDSDVEGIDVKQDADAELSGTVGDVQDNLEAALEAARALGDEKLEDQIGNTLTFFTRTHVVK